MRCVALPLSLRGPRFVPLSLRVARGLAGGAAAAAASRAAISCLATAARLSPWHSQPLHHTTGCIQIGWREHDCGPCQSSR